MVKLGNSFKGFENLEIWDILEVLSDVICNVLYYKMNVIECIIVEICLYYK